MLTPTPMSLYLSLLGLSRRRRLACLSRLLDAAKLPAIQRRYQHDYRSRTVHVPNRANGTIQLNILEPADGRHSPTGDVILYLTPGPLFGLEQARSTRELLKQNSPGADGLLQRTLAARTSATVVTVHHRVGPMLQGIQDEHEHEGKETRFFQFPTPVHDTLAAFDWINENLRPRALGTVGARIGGALAIMLALTEPQLVSATAAIAPISNWVDLDNWCITEQAEKEAAYSKEELEGAVSPSELVPLLATRERLFQIPDHYFSPFASPLLFLRSAGVIAPRSIPRYYTGPGYPVPKYRPPPKDEARALLDGELDDLEYQEIRVPTDSQRVLLSRPFYKVKGRYTKWRGPAPVTEDELRASSANTDGQSALPYTKIYTHDAKQAPLLASQGQSLAHALKYSCFADRKSQMAAERVQVSSLPASDDIWKFDDMNVVQSVGEFFAEIFDKKRRALQE